MFNATLPKLFLSMLCAAGAALPLHAGAETAANHVTFQQSSEEPYALVRDGQRTTYVGRHRSGDDAVEALRSQYPGKFLWFRQGGKAYVVRDPATVAAVEAAWAGAEKLGRDMEQIEAPMRDKSSAMEALGKKMEVSARAGSADTDAVGKQMDELGKSMDVLGKQMGALGKQLERASKQADAATRAALQDALRKGLAQVATG